MFFIAVYYCRFTFFTMYVLLTLSPSLIALTFSRSPSLSKSRSSGRGECFFFSSWPSSSCCPFVLHLLDFQRKVTTAAPVAGCRSVWWKAWCHSPFLTIFPGCCSCQLSIFFSFPFSFQHVIFLS